MINWLPIFFSINVIYLGKCCLSPNRARIYIQSCFMLSNHIMQVWCCSIVVSWFPLRHVTLFVPRWKVHFLCQCLKRLCKLMTWLFIRFASQIIAVELNCLQKTFDIQHTSCGRPITDYSKFLWVRWNPTFYIDASKPTDFWFAKLTLTRTKGDVVLLQCPEYTAKINVVLHSFAMDQNIIFHMD